MTTLSDNITASAKDLNSMIMAAKKKKLMVEISVGKTSFFIHPDDKDDTVPPLKVYAWKRQ